ncbi:hypothetical protein [Pseudoduganella buxea]|uniref:Uncharacterized protein n=1 Tax=Pseudoduganella buxea TaxID=1949069 RepID=A0A6I3T296_9BURK|nr:hypothetical protein [Pseudoduganella buxea]MTV55663.1 hypothetical protein [Pseudoduganella buxea]GGB93714.1 hypothetical protein GCM10011572_14600 [Pseudoduganella buxea]
MTSYIAMFMPVLWALVAAALALLLYRTSQAAFIGHIATDGTRRQLGLVGSVVIFVVIFVALAHYSPRPLIADLQAGRTSVPAQDLKALESSIGALERAADAVSGCLEVSSASECRAEGSDLQAKVSQVRAAHAQMHRSID